MDFSEQLKQFSKRVISLKDSIQTEEATKTSIIMPFFAMLGYDVFNPEEFVPEFTADVGIKKGEKVDYAIILDGNPAILIEAKWVGELLDHHGSQLFRYFGTTKAKFGILTNGIIYRFYTDLDEQNKMDKKPFLEINLLNLKDNQIPELMKFQKEKFNIEDIVDTASELKYSNEFKVTFAKELQDPSDDFLRIFLNAAYSGLKTQSVMDRFRPILKKALSEYINELMNDKIKSALNSDSASNKPSEKEQNSIPEEVKPENKIVTTPEEIGAYSLIKMLLKELVPIEDITYKDTVNYINILYQNKTTKWICRLILNNSRKILIIPDENKKEQKYSIESIYEIEAYKDQLINSLKRYVK
ncbi:MAG: type I restriction endonuclease [Clostridiales bacterium]|jgi:hypothetical protein|nr:type I restriction endonuclease [Clostridiales bacterium]MCI1960942.1 type I restriction endonuclease [Clostridiales bacterium]MCI2021383.1 type I restriction endonuclease [Clostridiales bacterium]MCI2025766.1 type I restriction endonuclease [Clostridiales bacterium]